MRGAGLAGAVVLGVLLVSLGAPLRADEPKKPLPLPPGPYFEDATALYGLQDLPAARVLLYDLDRDGYPDAVLNSAQLYRNRRHPSGRRMFERATSTGTLAGYRPERVSFIQPADLNGDGVTDLFVGRTTDLSDARFEDDGLRSEIWIGNGSGGYRIIDTSGVGDYAETLMSACFVDVNRDGYLDLFTGAAYTAYGQSLEAFPDRLYLGKGDGTFTDATAKAGLLGVPEPGGKDSRRPTYGVTHADWNGDGLQDLVTMSYGRQWNRLWRNQGDGTFTDAGPETGFDGDADRSGAYPPAVKERMQREDEPPFRSNGNTFDAAFADYDNDGDLDCFLAEIRHWWAGPSSDGSMLLRNLGKQGSFAFERLPTAMPRTHQVDSWNEGDLMAGWLDVDLDGRLDLVLASSDYPDDQLLRLFRQMPDGSFRDATSELGFVRRNACHISFGDVDGDGAPDILSGTNASRLTAEQRAQHDLSVKVYRNLLAAKLGHKSVTIRLEPGTLEREGEVLRVPTIGAQVTVEHAGIVQRRDVQGGQGHAGHRDDDACIFGVGTAETVTVTVRWPDAKGKEQRFEKVAAGKRYRLKPFGELTAETE